MKWDDIKIKDTLKKELAAALYREGILSIGGARKLAHMTKTDFHFFLGNKQIERQYDAQDYRDDVENIEHWPKKVKTRLRRSLWVKPLQK